MTVSEKIQEARSKAGLTQQQLADAIGTTTQNISQYERGVRNPKIETLRKIADAFGVPVTEFLDRKLLTTVPTCELVEELEKRAGVETTIAEPYQDMQVKVNGPAIVLVVID